MIFSVDIEKIKALSEILNANGLSAIEVGEGESRIRIERELSAVPVQKEFTSPLLQVPVTTMAPVDKEGAVEKSIDFNRLIEVISPLVGVYYAASSPDAEPFVSIGSRVKKGDVLCIIETMKLMNEIVAEQDGEIVDICVKNGDIAEYGQVLFKMH